MTEAGRPTRPRRRSRSLRWGAGVALLVLMPKCVLCAVAYLGLGALLGLTGPELCGAAPETVPKWLWLAVALGLALGVVSIGWLRLRRRGTTTPAVAGRPDR